MNESPTDEFIKLYSLLNINEVLRIIGLSRRTLYKMIKDEEFPKPYKITGSRIAWKQEQITEWLSQLEVGSFNGD